MFFVEKRLLVFAISLLLLLLSVRGIIKITDYVYDYNDPNICKTLATVTDIMHTGRIPFYTTCFDNGKSFDEWSNFHHFEVGKTYIVEYTYHSNTIISAEEVDLDAAENTSLPSG